MAFVYWIHLPEHTDIMTEGYIGFTSKSVQQRWERHKSISNSKQRCSYTLYRSIRKYNSALVVDTILEGSNEYCLLMEYKLRPTEDIGWNISCGGSAPNLGRTHSDEVRDKMSKSRTGELHPLFGQNHTSESKYKMSLAKQGVYSGYLHPKACDIWLIAEEVHDYFSSNSKIGVVRLSKIFGYSENQTKSILKMLRSGWNPSTDSEYLRWVCKQTTNKELHESTQSS